MTGLKILTGDSATSLKRLPAQCVQTCVTSPPYWGLRDYGVAGQIGLERDPLEYVAKIVAVFHEVWRVLKDDGTLWVNLGDIYICGAAPERRANSSQINGRKTAHLSGFNKKGLGLPPKSLVGIPWRVALAMQDYGWVLRSDIIWNKPNPMPESARDRPTRSHEYLFQFSKQANYFYDQEAVMEPCSPGTHLRMAQDVVKQIGSLRAYAGQRHNGPMKACVRSPKTCAGEDRFTKNNSRFAENVSMPVYRRNKRTVWTVSTEGYKEAHFATYPRKLIEPCILAGSRVGDTVLDPFGGSGTTAAVALGLKRKAIIVELNPDYVAMIKRRCAKVQAENPIKRSETVDRGMRERLRRKI